MNLITVAQALHWFDIPRFFEEAVRVLSAGGILAFWCYERCRVGPDCDALIERVFAEVEPYWPPERQLVDDGYRNVGMPLVALETPEFEMRVLWTADQLLDYSRTWSAAQRYLVERRADPAQVIEAELRDAWGPGPRTVTWPITLTAGRAD